MTAYARVITIGRNADMPKVVKIPVGVGVDGCAIRAPITIRGNQTICPDCDGWAEGCERCDDSGIVDIEQETAAVSRCLPAAAVGRSLSLLESGRPLYSGMTPVSRATGGLSLHNAERGTRPSVLRSVPSSSASHRPAADMPPIALQGTLERVLDGVTVLVGMAVFGGLAWFFLVLAA